MALNANERQVIINHLVQNCPALDADTLGRMPDERLTGLKEHFDKQALAVTVANAAVHGVKDPETGVEMRINPQTGKWERRVDNAKKAPPKEEEEYEEDEEEEEDMEANAMHGDEDPPASKKKATTNTRSFRSAEDWFAAAPDNVRRTFQHARDLEQQAKDELIAKLLVNVAESDKQNQWARLRNRSLPELRADLSMMPRQPSQEEIDRAAGASKVLNRRQPDDDMLDLPSSSWSAVGDDKGAPAANRGQQQSADDLFAETVSEEEEFKALTPRMQAIVRNAMSVEAGKRHELVEEIIANLADDSNERKWRSKLQDKSLAELKDLYEMMPKRDRGATANYFSPSPIPASAVHNDSNEDLLPLPSYDYEQPPVADKGKQNRA